MLEGYRGFQRKVMPPREGNWSLCSCSEFSHLFGKSHPEGQRDMLFFSGTDLNTTTPRRSLSLCKEPTHPFPPTSDLILFHILCRAGVREPDGAMGAELGPAVCCHKTWEKCNTARLSVEVVRRVTVS